MTIERFISSTLLWLMSMAFAAQFAIDFSTDNIATSCIILSYVCVTLFYFRWSSAFKTHPLSSFAILGFCVTSGLGALLAQSMAWTAVGDSLHQPLLTFSILAMYQFIALIAHVFYRILTSSSTNKQGLVRHALQALGVYATPSVINLWFMGGIGVFSLLLSHISPVANGLSFLAWAPFLIPIYVQQYGSKYCSAKKNYLFLLPFSTLIALMAMFFNARGMLLSGFMTVALLFLLVGMRSTKPIDTSLLLKLIMVGLFGAVLSWPASNLVTAMAVARSDRGKVSPVEMVSKTLENFKDTDKLERYKKLALAKDLRTAYDEKYINNPMMARLVITKYHDNAIYFAGKISDRGADEIMKISEDFLWTTLPQPWLDALKIDVDKDRMQFSIGDTLAHFAIGTPLSGLRTGSIFGEGWVLFGYLFPVIYFGMCLILFIAIDLFSMRTAAGVTVLSVIGMLNVWPNFLFGITADSLHHLFIGVVRGVAQPVILYAIVFAIAKGLSNLYLKLTHSKSSFDAAIIGEN